MVVSPEVFGGFVGRGDWKASRERVATKPTVWMPSAHHHNPVTHSPMMYGLRDLTDIRHAKDTHKKDPKTLSETWSRRHPEESFLGNFGLVNVYYWILSLPGPIKA